MIISTGKDLLMRLLTTQLSNNFLLEQPDEETRLLDTLETTLPDVERCFSKNSSRYYRAENGEVLFDPYQTCQYAIYLYFLARNIWRQHRDSRLASKVYALNKMLNACDLFYEVDLPDVFSCDHPIGAVMGRANYSNCFRFSQSCCVGNNKGAYPTIGERVTLLPYAKVVGDCNIGNNVFISNGAYVIDADIPDNSIVFGNSPDLVIKSRPPEYFLPQCGFICD